MRIWSIHPKYLDSKRLVAVWRETLLAKQVLKGKTKGYKNHPQLMRFKKEENPVLFLDSYLYHLYQEAVKRDYNFNIRKIGKKITDDKILVADKQIIYEFEHLKKKLDYPQNLIKEDKRNEIEPHPIFRVVKGDVAEWEKQTNKL